MRAAFDLLLTQEREPALHEIEPGGARRREVQMKPRMADEPAADRRRLMRAVVVEDQMNVEIGGYAHVDRLEEPQEFLAAMPPMTLADDFAGRHVERCEQRRRAMPAVVVRPPLRRTECHRQNRGSAIERLNLALLVHTQDQGAVRRIEIEADDVPHFVHEERVARQLERLTPMRL